MEKKKHKADDFIGQVIMVDPAITTKEESGKTGIIVSISQESRLAQIEFADGLQAEIAVEKLITLTPKAKIMQGLMNSWDISPDDFQIALKTCKLISEKRFTEALQRAVTNNITKALCTINCTLILAAQNNKKRKNGLKK